MGFRAPVNGYALAMSHGESRPGPRSPASAAAAKNEKKIQGVIGVGLDDDGGHHRVTKGPDFQLVGGSAETHERMQDLVMRMRETLKRQGKTIRDLNRREFEDLARDSLE